MRGCFGSPGFLSRISNSTFELGGHPFQFNSRRYRSNTIANRSQESFDALGSARLGISLLEEVRPELFAFPVGFYDIEGGQVLGERMQFELDT